MTKSTAMSRRGARVLAFCLGTACAILSPLGTAGEWELTYTGELWSNTRGGLETSERYLDNLDLTYTRGDLFGRPGTTLFAYVLYNNGASFTEGVVGDLQTLSNIDAPRALRLYEFWVSSEVGSNGEFLFGLFDLNSEFDAIDTASLFINSSHGIGPDFAQSGENGPSIFPSTSLAARYRVDLTDALTLSAAVFDAVPGDPDNESRTTVQLGDGLLGVAELNFTPSASSRLGVGVWRYSRRSPSIDEIAGDDHNEGAYAIGEWRLYSEEDDAQGLSAFVRYGVANDRVNELDSYIGAGVVYQGLLPRRPEDHAGLAIAHARSGDPFRDAQALAGVRPESAETAVELTYRFSVNPWLTLQPDLQYIVNPGLDPALDDALAIGLRFEFGIGGVL